MLTTAKTKKTRESNTRNNEGDSVREKDEFAKHLFETVREPFLALTSNLNVKFANKAFYKSFQVSPEETLGKRIYDLGNTQWNIPKLRMLLEEIVPLNNSFNDFEVEHEFEHIGRKTMLLNARRVNSGRLILLAIEDITERKRIENALKNFAYIASHDLKEPLRMVTSYLTLLEKEPNRYKEKTEEYLRFAVDGTKRMSALINNLLVHADVGIQVKVGPVDFNLVLQNVLADLSLSLSEVNAQVTNEELPTVLGDSTEFEQLLQNLISNAIKYKGKENPKVHVSAKKEGTDWRFIVEDNGMGIAKEDQKRIFDAFERLHSRSEYPGSGLGLSTCKKIIESHGGRIWVESSPGRGSTFFFTLPASLEG